MAEIEKKEQQNDRKNMVEKQRSHQPGFSVFLLYRKLFPCKVKNAPRGCALRRIR